MIRRSRTFSFHTRHDTMVSRYFTFLGTRRWWMRLCFSRPVSYHDGRRSLIYPESYNLLFQTHEQAVSCKVMCCRLWMVQVSESESIFSGVVS